MANGSQSSINAFNASYGASEVHGTHGSAYFNANGSADVFSYGGEMLNEVVVTNGGNYSAAIAADIYSRSPYDYLRDENGNYLNSLFKKVDTFATYTGLAQTFADTGALIAEKRIVGNAYKSPKKAYKMAFSKPYQKLLKVNNV